MKKTIVSLMCLFGLCLGGYAQTWGTTNQTVVTNYIVVTNVVYVQPRMNMDSYEYYQHYYLHPRAMGYSYQLMYPAPVYYRPPTVSFSFGFGGHPYPYPYRGGHHGGHRR